MAFWCALRRWAACAVAAGVLTVDHIRSSDPAACTLLEGGISSAAPAAPADGAEDVAELLDLFLCALVDLLSNIYADIMTAIPEPLYDRLDRYMEERLKEADSQP